MIVEHAYAKLNLALDVVGKRQDGYHDLQMIVIPIQLADILILTISDNITLECSMDIHDNAVLKTVHYIKNKYAVKKGVHIKLDKHIPIGSGLGGESADIAATIRGLNKLWKLNLGIDAMSKIALDLGSDTLFCLFNKTALVTGRGEHLKFLDNPPIKDIYLLISEHPISTREAFSHYVPKTSDISFKTVLKSYESKDYKTFFNKAFNGLLETAFSLDKTLKNTCIKLKKHYKNAYMTGSGSTLFIIENFEKKLKIKEMESISNRKVIKTALFV